jgi:hypothetical protein
LAGTLGWIGLSQASEKVDEFESQDTRVAAAVRGARSGVSRDTNQVYSRFSLDFTPSTLVRFCGTLLARSAAAKENQWVDVNRSNGAATVYLVNATISNNGGSFGMDLGYEQSDALSWSYQTGTNADWTEAGKKVTYNAERWLAGLSGTVNF